MKELLLQAPDGQLADSIKPMIQKWDEPEPTALQVLEVLDHCVFSALASEFGMKVLNILYEQAIERENTTKAGVAERAVWRNSEEFQ